MDYQIDSGGKCFRCKTDVSSADVLSCFDCKLRFHAICGDLARFANKSFVKSFKSVKSKNFPFQCDHCVTKRETRAASTVEEQIQNLTAVIKDLVAEVQQLKSENRPHRTSLASSPEESNSSAPRATEGGPTSAWSNKE